jgi:phage terminase large subunit
MVSLPDCPQLIAELSLPTYSLTETGKIRIEGKEQMRRRGVKSPDHADALAVSFAPCPVPGRAASAGGRPAPAGSPYRGAGAYGPRGGSGYGPRG